MTSVDYKTKVYDIYMIKEDLGFTAVEKPKADCSGISVFSLGIAITTAAGSKKFSVCKYAWFLQDSLFNSFIFYHCWHILRSQGNHTMCSVFSWLLSCIQPPDVCCLNTWLFRIYHTFHVWNRYMSGGKVEFVASLPQGDGESPDSLLRSPWHHLSGRGRVSHHCQLRIEVQAATQVLFARLLQRCLARLKCSLSPSFVLVDCPYPGPLVRRSRLLLPSPHFFPCIHWYSSSLSLGYMRQKQNPRNVIFVPWIPRSLVSLSFQSRVTYET